MADKLTLPNGTPYNVVVENGRMLIDPSVFGGLGSNMPREFRILPAELTPANFVTYNGKRYAYVPETALAKYLTSSKFKENIDLYSATQGFTAVQNVVNATNRATDTLKSFDVNQRSKAWDSAPKKTKYVATTTNIVTTDRDGKKVDLKPNPTPFTPSRGLSEMGGNNLPGGSIWAAFANIANTADRFGLQTGLDGSQSLTQKGGTINSVAFPDQTGKIKTQDLESFISNLRTSRKEDILKNEKLLKKYGWLKPNYKVTGNINETYVQTMAGVYNLLSAQNYSIWSTGQYAPDKQNLKPVSFEDFVKNNVNDSPYKGTGSSSTSVSTSINAEEYSLAESRAILEDFYASALGRRPNETEVKQFSKLINEKAKAKPNVSKTVTTSGEGYSTSKTTGTQGFGDVDAKVMARQKAEADPKANAFLTNTKYFDAFLSAIQSPLG